LVGGRRSEPLRCKWVTDAWLIRPSPNGWRRDACPISQSIELFTLYRKQKGQTELHVSQMGAHGFVNKGGGADHYLDRLEEWLATNKLLTKPAN
jgi:hypothetical protein